MRETSHATVEEWHEVTEIVPMTCRHGENVTEAEKVMSDCRRGLVKLGWAPGKLHFLSALTLSLENDLGGWFIDFIAVDMWWGAAISQYKVEDGKCLPGRRLTTQGDSAEDCLAALWLRAREIHAETAPEDVTA